MTPTACLPRRSRPVFSSRDSGPRSLPSAGRAGDRDVYRIGIPKSASRDVPPSLLSFAGMPFKDLMKSQTGLNGEVVMDSDAMNIARMLESDKLQLGVFLGHEFAWVREKHPTLEPIVCTVPRPKEIRAFLLVRWDNKAENLSDLKVQTCPGDHQPRPRQDVPRQQRRR